MFSMFGESFAEKLLFDDSIKGFKMFSSWSEQTVVQMVILS